jgi:hypothetical protein
VLAGQKGKAFALRRNRPKLPQQQGYFEHADFSDDVLDRQAGISEKNIRDPRRSTEADDRLGPF